MPKRWTREEDEILLRYHGVGADFVATHDLGRPSGSGSRRMAHLTKSGARFHFAAMMLQDIEFEVAAGRGGYGYADLVPYWEQEMAIGMAAIRKT